MLNRHQDKVRGREDGCKGTGGMYGMRTGHGAYGRSRVRRLRTRTKRGVRSTKLHELHRRHRGNKHCVIVLHGMPARSLRKRCKRQVHRLQLGQNLEHWSVGVRVMQATYTRTLRKLRA